MSRTIPIDYPVQIWQEGKPFVAHTTPLDVRSAGQAPRDARKALDEAVSLFVSTAADLGTGEEML